MSADGYTVDTHNENGRTARLRSFLSGSMTSHVLMTAFGIAGLYRILAAGPLQTDFDRPGIPHALHETVGFFELEVALLLAFALTRRAGIPVAWIATSVAAPLFLYAGDHFNALISLLLLGLSILAFVTGREQR